ncbi:MAG: protein TolR [Rhodobacteraceae bacterium]|jgi:biopolymer transport protein TolR|nr:protein TolR [Paracoccaceae bacterium]MBC65991.1 protein TolR [Paracoccaceae bacterium]RZO39258.1 MAG: protein TolR [Paracoccaceae bacterium]|tara:strand:+ start:266 stop:727 length:462 start_codon:yes stop_codon:yes gene_type:complete
MVSLKRNRKNLGKRNRYSNGLMAEINVTPFVDVMLVLLIIFMVAAPLLTVGVPVELPKTAATPLPNEQEEPLTITLTEDGSLWLQKSEIQFDELETKLRSILVERNNNKIFLRADGANSYEIVMRLMGALNNSGFNNIGLVTDTGGPTFNGGF